MISEIILYTSLALGQLSLAAEKPPTDAAVEQCEVRESRWKLSPGDPRVRQLLEDISQRSRVDKLQQLADRELSRIDSVPVSIVLRTSRCSDEASPNIASGSAAQDAKWEVGQIGSFPTHNNLPEGSTITLDYCASSIQNTVVFTKQGDEWVVTSVNSELLTAGCPPV